MRTRPAVRERGGYTKGEEGGSTYAAGQASCGSGPGSNAHLSLHHGLHAPCAVMDPHELRKQNKCTALPPPIEPHEPLAQALKPSPPPPRTMEPLDPGRTVGTYKGGRPVAVSNSGGAAGRGCSTAPGEPCREP